MKFPGGAVRDEISERWDLIPAAGAEAVAKAMRDGAERYGENNYRKGMPAYVMLNHAIRHLFRHLDGDRTEDHLGHAGANVLMAIAVEKTKADKAASDRESLEAVAKLAGIPLETFFPKEGCDDVECV